MNFLTRNRFNFIDSLSISVVSVSLHDHKLALAALAALVGSVVSVTLSQVWGDQ